MSLAGFEITEMTAEDYDEVASLWRSTEGIGLDSAAAKIKYPARL